jgi:hypothetical protein
MQESGSRAFIAEYDRCLGLTCIRRWERLAERERIRVWASGAKNFELGYGFCDTGPMVSGHPKEHEKGIVHARKPLATPAHNFHMR